jgi:hypothetical protein
VLAVAGRRNDALAQHRDALRLSTSSADVRFVATALEGVAGCLTDTDAARSAMLLGAAETILGAPVPGTGADRAYLDGTTARARAALGDRLYEEALETGRALTVHEAADLALRDERTSSPTPT